MKYLFLSLVLLMVGCTKPVCDNWVVVIQPCSTTTSTVMDWDSMRDSVEQMKRGEGRTYDEF